MADEPDGASRTRRGGPIDLLFRAVVLGTAVYIAVSATARPHADYPAVFLSLVFMLTALGYSLEGIAKFFGRH